MRLRRVTIYILAIFATVLGAIWYCLGVRMRQTQSPQELFAISAVSKNTENDLVASDAVQYDGKKNRLIIIYSLQDEQQWTHPTNNYSYPPWYYLCYSII